MSTWARWEDYRSGLYGVNWNTDQVAASRALLTDLDQFAEVALEMTREWPVAAEQNLRHMWSGRNAWVGQASCLYSHGAPGVATRLAWAKLSNPEQDAANRVARAVRESWERGWRAETLFAG